MERGEFIQRRESFWYHEPHREALLAELFAISNDPPRHRPKSIALIIVANGGKTAFVKRFLFLHPPEYNDEIDRIPAIYLSMTSILRVEELSVELLRAIRAVSPDEVKTHSKRMKHFVQQAKTVGLRLIFLDEFHDCADTTGKGKPFLRCIKDLINQNLLVVPMGTEELKEVLQGDAQLASRFNFKQGRLTLIADKTVVKALMEKLAGNIELKITDAAVKFVIKITCGVLGHILDLVEGTLIKFGTLKLADLREYSKTLDALT